MIYPIVVDTNFLISGYLWKGKPRQVIRLIRSGSYRFLYASQTLDELVRVLSTKFSLDASEIYRIVEDIRSFGKEVTIVSKECPVADDASDNVFVNLALDGKAKIILSGDSHLLRLKRFKGIEIIPVAEFLTRASSAL